MVGELRADGRPDRAGLHELRAGPWLNRWVRFSFTADLWRYQGEAAWYFVTVPLETSEQIRELTPPRRGFGSVRVEVTLAGTTWRTSLFPDAASGSYVLPIKKAVRTAAAIDDGDPADIHLRLLDQVGPGPTRSP